MKAWIKKSRTTVRACLAFSLIAMSAFAVPEEANAAQTGGAQRVEEYNLDKSKVALQGYDPVSYFKDGPEKGNKSISLTHEGVTYYFANEANKIEFQGDPQKYEPAFGGWCATAMLDGTKYKIDPKTYKIVNGRNFLFYKGLLGNALKDWEKRTSEGSEADLVKKADEEWSKHLQQ